MSMCSHVSICGCVQDNTVLSVSFLVCICKGVCLCVQFVLKSELVEREEQERQHQGNGCLLLSIHIYIEK
jgi:hypothetical protein